MLILPVVFILSGVLLGKNYLEKLDFSNIASDDGEDDTRVLMKLNEGDINILDKIHDINEGMKIFVLSIFIVQAYCLNTSVFIGTPVQEREFNLRYALRVMGCRSLP